MSKSISIESIKLSNGIEIPRIGLGTLKADDPHELSEAVKFSIKAGYKHFDCAWLYANEDIVGKALKEAIDESNGQLKREDLFLTSKVWNTFHSKDMVRKCFDESLSKLGVDYIDLYLVHWPLGFAENIGDEPFPTDSEGNRLYSDVHYLETYRAMEELVDEGLVKSIGVSNFNIRQLTDVLENCDIKPVNNQIEVHPYLQNDKLIEFCQNNNIVVSCYGPLAGCQKSKKRPDLPILLKNQTLESIAKKYKNKSPAQVCLRWAIQRNLVVLPKSVTPERILENAQAFDFELTDKDMDAIKSINQNLRFYGNSLKDHKFYPFNEDETQVY